MKILAVECSAGPASVAIVENGRILANSFINVKLTHSQTLLPMIKSLLASAMISINDIEGIAVAAGPGSFTGIRIGISAVKGLAAPKNSPCVAVSTLRAMAESFIDEECIVCAVMDARCNQVYNALFDVCDGKIVRLCNDRALMCDELAEEIKSRYNYKKIYLCGDGADMFYSNYASELSIALLSAEPKKYQSAVGVALAAEENFILKKTLLPEQLLPVYLRLPQAERELKEKNQKENKL